MRFPNFRRKNTEETDDDQESGQRVNEFRILGAIVLILVISLAGIAYAESGFAAGPTITSVTGTNTICCATTTTTSTQAPVTSTITQQNTQLNVGLVTTSTITSTTTIAGSVTTITSTTTTTISTTYTCPWPPYC